MQVYVRWMEGMPDEDLGDVGEETATLCRLMSEGLPIPNGFVVTATAFHRFAEMNGLMRDSRAGLDLSGGPAANNARALQDAVVEAGMDPALEAEILSACRRLREGEDRAPLSVSIRPAVSATLPFESGLQNSLALVLPIGDASSIIASVKQAWASVWTPDLLERCGSSGIDPSALAVSLRVQRFVSPTVSGVLVTTNPASVARREIVIDARWGLGDVTVSATLDNDRFVLQSDPQVLLEQSVGNKQSMIVFSEEGTGGTREVAVPEDRAEMPCLGWDQIEEIAETGSAVEKIEGGPQKIDWAIHNGKLFILRAIPLRVGAACKTTSVPDGMRQASSSPSGNKEALREKELTQGTSPVERAVVKETERDPEGSAGIFPGWKLSWNEKVRAEVLTSLFRAGKRLQRKGGQVLERDEFSHKHTADRYWNESYYFNFSDPDNRIGGFSRIGMVPNQDLAIGILYLFLPDRGILMATQSDPCRASSDTISAGLIRYERLSPLREWRIRFQGNMLHLKDPADLPAILYGSPEDIAGRRLSFNDAFVDIRFRGWSPCHNFKDVDPGFVAERFVSAGCRLTDLRAVTRVASEHYEQVGGWEGKIVLDGERFEIRGSGHRDHSWGVRDWKAPRKWTWLTAQFGPSFGFNLSRVAIRSLDLFNGYVSRDGSNFPLRRAWLETDFEKDGLTQAGIRIWLQDTSGWEARIVGRPRIVVPLVLREDAHRTLINEAFTEYRWQGNTGFGISEYLHQLPDV